MWNIAGSRYIQLLSNQERIDEVASEVIGDIEDGK